MGTSESKSMPTSHSKWTLVLLGESGSGKSASGNTILGQKKFLSKPSSKAVTTQCTWESRDFNGQTIKLIDTPDFYHNNGTNQGRNVKQCRQVCEGQVCVYLLVIQIGRFTEGERDILDRLEKTLQTNVRDRAIILFTYGDDLEDQTIEDYINNTDIHLQSIIKKCGTRYVVFNNRQQDEGEGQVKKLMEITEALTKKPLEVAITTSPGLTNVFITTLMYWMTWLRGITRLQS